jgi:hypothetical protein
MWPADADGRTAGAEVLDRVFDAGQFALDTARRRSYDPGMPLWRCPHCGTPQAESSRCWVCRRSTTSCATCRHFRRGVASGLGLCGLDPRHTALVGTEMRPCWAAPDPIDGVARAAPVAAVAGRIEPPDDERPRPRTFVPVEDLARPRDVEPRQAEAVLARRDQPRQRDQPGPASSVAGGAQDRAGWSLWGDLEP